MHDKEMSSMKRSLSIFTIAILVLSLSGVAALAAPHAQSPTPQVTPQSAGSQQATPAAAGAIGATASGQNQGGHPLTYTLRASRLFGYRVINVAGEVLGQVENLVLQLAGSGGAAQGSAPARADILYLVVGRDGGGRVAVPAVGTNIDPQAGLFVVDFSSGDLENAPTFASGDVAVQGGAWDTDLRSYWQERGMNVPQNQAGDKVTASQLMRFNIDGANNQQVGRVDDLLLQFVGRPASAANQTGAAGAQRPGSGTAQGRAAGTTGAADIGLYVAAMPVESAFVRYAIVGVTSGDGNPVRRAMPLTATRFNPDARALTLDNRVALRDIPPLTNQALVNDPGWDRSIEFFWRDLGFEVPGVSARTASSASLPSSLYYRASRLLGLPVIGIGNETLGDVEDILVPVAVQSQDAGSQPTGIDAATMGYALVGLGGFLGLGEDYIAIPLSQMRLRLVNPLADDAVAQVGGAPYGYPRGFGYYGSPYGSTAPGAAGQADPSTFVLRDAFMVNLTQEDFDAAPRLDLGGIDLSAPDWDANLRGFWQERGAAFREQGDGPAVRVSNVGGLFDYDVFDSEGNDIGDVAEFLVHFDLASVDAEGQALGQGAPIESAALRYAVVESGGFLGIGARTTLVPLPVMRIETDEGGVSGFHLPVAGDRLDAAPSFDIADDAFRVEEVDNEFLPYWDEQGIQARD
jgi:hypothetical protein